LDHEDVEGKEAHGSCGVEQASRVGLFHERIVEDKAATAENQGQRGSHHPIQLHFQKDCREQGHRHRVEIEDQGSGRCRDGLEGGDKAGSLQPVHHQAEKGAPRKPDAGDAKEGAITHEHDRTEDCGGVGEAILHHFSAGKAEIIAQLDQDRQGAESRGRNDGKDESLEHGVCLVW
jgi:hypothetical protein